MKKPPPRTAAPRPRAPRRPAAARAPQARASEAEIQEQRYSHTGRQLLLAYRAFKALATQKLRERGHEGLGTSHTAILPHIHVEGTRLTTLARLAGVTKQSAAEIVQDLERQGYVKRSVDPEDRRATLVTFTRTGWRFLQDAHDIKRDIDAEYAQVLGARGLEELRRLLGLLVSHFGPLAHEDAGPGVDRPGPGRAEQG